MESFPANDLLGAAAEEILAQLKAIPLVRERVFRYIPDRAQKRLAGRIAQAVLSKVFQRAATVISLQERDFAVDVLADRGSRFPARAQYVRWCYTCKTNRPAHYSELALRCMKCGRPTVAMREESEDEPRAAEPVRPSSLAS